VTRGKIRDFKAKDSAGPALYGERQRGGLAFGVNARHEVIELKAGNRRVQASFPLLFVLNGGLAGNVAKLPNCCAEAHFEDPGRSALTHARGKELTGKRIHIRALLIIGGVKRLGRKAMPAVQAEVTLDLRRQGPSSVEAGSDDASGKRIINGQSAGSGRAGWHQHDFR
jgi:hypothetical protein